VQEGQPQAGVEERQDTMTASDQAQDAEAIVADAQRAGGEDRPPYRPGDHLMTLDRGRGGRGAYMMVEDRVLWFRSDHPQGSISQELIRLDLENGFALFKTVAETGDGGRGDGYGSETRADFADFIEKAASKSCGRALAALGYGTKGALAEGEMADTPAPLPHLGSRGGNRDADRGPGGRGQAPDNQTQTRTISAGNGWGRANQPQVADQGSQRATERQVKFIFALAREAGLDETALAEWSQELFQQEVDQLNRRDASALIEAIQRRRQDLN